MSDPNAQPPFPSDGTPPPPSQAPPPQATPPPPPPGTPPQPGGFQQPPQAPGYQAPGQYPAAAPPPSSSSSQKGCLIAAGIVVLVLVLGVVGCSVFAARAGNEIGESFEEFGNELDAKYGEADPSEYSVEFDSCAVNDLGFAEAEATVKNERDLEMAFNIDVSFTKDDLVIDNVTAYSETMGAGESSLLTVTSFKDSSLSEGDDIECAVTGANRNQP